MQYIIIPAVMAAADIQLILLYISKMKRFKKTKDEQLLVSARRYFIGSVCLFILTLALIAFMAVRQLDALLSVFSEV